MKALAIENFGNGWERWNNKNISRRDDFCLIKMTNFANHLKNNVKNLILCKTSIGPTFHLAIIQQITMSAATIVMVTMDTQAIKAV